MGNLSTTKPLGFKPIESRGLDCPAGSVKLDEPEASEVLKPGDRPMSWSHPFGAVDESITRLPSQK